MNRDQIIQTLQNILPMEEGQILVNAPMDCRTGFRAGGKADLLIVLQNCDHLGEVLQVLRQEGMPVFVMGNGSNLLVRDGGIRGAVIQIGKDASQIRVEGERIFVSAGAMLSAIGSKAAEAGLDGFVFASGIPGTFGGAIVMNAGAYGGEMKDVVESVDVLTPQGEKKTLSVDELDFSYRHSVIAQKGYVVLGGVIHLQKGDKEQIRSQMRELAEKRRNSQPLQYPSCGSTFKRPAGFFAAKLIDDAGLKGLQVGGAQVSEKHAGFIVNTGNATATDILQLIRLVQEKVQQAFGVWLEPEIRIVGEDGSTL